MKSAHSGEGSVSSALEKGGILFQFAGALCLLGGGLSVIVGLGTGRWPPLLEFERFPGGALGPMIFVTLEGVLFVLFGYHVQRGRTWAAAGATCISWLSLAIAVVNLAMHKSGWFELAFFLVLVVGGHACWAAARDAARQNTRATGPETDG